MSYNVLRSCAAHGGHHLAYSSRSFGGSYFCPAFLRAMFEDFDPQPYENCQGQPDRQRVHMIDDPYKSDYVVVARDGDNVTIRSLAFPDQEPVTVSVHNLYPGSMMQAYARAPRCGK